MLILMVTNLKSGYHISRYFSRIKLVRIIKEKLEKGNK